MRPIEECPVCGARGFEPFALDPWTPGRLHFAQARCAGCGLLAAQPRATDEELDAYYASAYYDQHWPDAEAVSAENRALYERCEWPLMQKLWADGPPPAQARVLDVGAGYGILLRLLRDKGYAVAGSEMSARALGFCREQDLDVVEGKAPGLPFPVASFDVVVSMHVIEHVRDPRGFVTELASLARPGGLVVLVTEDAWISQYAWDRVRARLTGRLPCFRSSTDHTFVFEAPHLARLLQEAGCESVKTEAFTYPPPPESLHWRLYKGFFRRLDRLLGHGEYLIAVGRKPDGRLPR